MPHRAVNRFALPIQGDLPYLLSSLDPGNLTASIEPHPHLARYYSADEGKAPFLRRIFNQTAGDYDRIERLMALGSGSWYRRSALRRAGLGHGMRVLDVAVGTGLVARQEITLTGDARLVLGIDPSIGMLSQALRSLPIAGLLATAEELPLAGDQFDFLSMGYALRHLPNLESPFRQFHRVLKPGGRVCILEITRPRSRLARAMVRAYLSRIVPAVTRLTTGHADSQRLWEYYWETIDRCVPAETVEAALRSAGFENVRHDLEFGLFSAYTAQRRAG